MPPTALTSRWQLNASSAAHVAAMDIVGFSRRLNDASALKAIRLQLIRAVERTTLFPAARANLWAHFLGDELRLAFLADQVDTYEAREFVEQVIVNLSESDQEQEEKRAEVVSVLTTGHVKALEWKGCRYLHGAATHKAQRWMDSKQIGPGELAVDSNFGAASGANGPGPGWRAVTFDSDQGWLKSVLSPGA